VGGGATVGDGGSHGAHRHQAACGVHQHPLGLAAAGHLLVCYRRRHEGQRTSGASSGDSGDSGDPGRSGDRTSDERITQQTGEHVGTNEEG
jgi:hypothetical protein